MTSLVEGRLIVCVLLLLVCDDMVRTSCSRRRPSRSSWRTRKGRRGALLTGTRLQGHGGRLREVQNWIGGSDHNPCSAAFVPPPPGYGEPLMIDLVAFANSSALSAVAQAALAHAQFETIHPSSTGTDVPAGP